MVTPVSGDGELVTRALSGDRAAFGELYNRYFPSVYDFLLRTLRNGEDAADAAQDTFQRAARSLASLAKPAAFKSWLFSIAYGRAMDRLARQKHLSPLSRSHSDAELAPLLERVDPERLANTTEAAGTQEAAHLVWQAATVLNRRAYAVFDLHVRQGLESAEMAEVLGVGKGNAFTMLNRLMRAVEEVLGAYMIMQRGIESCPTLHRIVGRFTVPPLTQDMCRNVERHVSKCDVCQQTRRSLPAPLGLFGAFAVVTAPAGLAEGIWKNVEGHWMQPGRRAVKKVRLGKGLWALARKTETAERGSGQVFGGRDLVLVLCAVLLLAALPVLAIFALPINSGSGSNSPSGTASYDAATKRPVMDTRTPAPTASVTATRAPTTPSPTEMATITPVLPATQHPRVLSTPTPPVARPTRTEAPTEVPQPTATSGPSGRPTPVSRPTQTPLPTLLPLVN